MKNLETRIADLETSAGINTRFPSVIVASFTFEDDREIQKASAGSGAARAEISRHRGEAFDDFRARALELKHVVNFGKGCIPVVTLY